MSTQLKEKKISLESLVKNIKEYNEKLNKWEIESIKLKDDKLNLTLISSETYNYFQDLAENIEIYKEIISRQNKDDFVDWNEILSKFNILI